MGYRADLLGLTFSAGEISATPKGQHLGQLREVAVAQLTDALRTLKELYARTSDNQAAITTIINAL